MKFQKGEKINFPDEGYNWNQLGALAQKFYMEYNELSFEELKQDLDLVVERILALIESKNETELYSVLFYKKYPLGRMIQLNTSSPYKNALKRIRFWKKNG